ncbi:OmpA family protein [Neobacillus sp. D3-1R]|uniref:OmpA family protein n=1 Tax=Neobacillus sp. D3-1R TaxID=3445778 RepID=UPI003F9FC138
MFTKYRRLFQTRNEETDFWPTFTDLLASILLVILLIMVYTISEKSAELKEKEKDITRVEFESKKIHKENLEYREKIKKIMGIRVEIVHSLQEAFEKSNLKIEIDPQTGTVSFSGNVLFESGKDILQTNFQKELDKVIPVYISALLSKEFEGHVSEIIVEGYTDDEGDYFENLDLSQRRAFNVAKYILGKSSPSYPVKGKLKDYITANGRSETKLILNKDGSVNRQKSRRVEIKFRLKDDQRMQEIIQTLPQK